jgi:hypothetical protein
MWAQIDRILREATNQIADHVANFLPGLLVALLLVLATVIAAVLVRAVLARALRGLEFDQWAERTGLVALVGRPVATSPSNSLARLVAWTILFLGLLVSLTALNATIPSQFALSVFEYIPNVLAGLMIFVAGTIAARFLARSVLIGAVNMGMQSARLPSLAVKWLVQLVTVAMTLDHLGIGRNVLLLAFGILFGGIVLAAALAVGLGARDAVKEALSRQIHDPSRGDDTVNHV